MFSRRRIGIPALLLFALAGCDEANPDLHSPDPLVRGEAIFDQVCADCHGPRGQGDALYPPLANTRWTNGDPADTARVLVRGLEGPITVAGRRYSGTMPSQGHRSDEDLIAVGTWVRQAWGNDAPPLTASDIAAARGEVP